MRAVLAVLATLFVTFANTAIHVAPGPASPADPFLDPKADPDNPLRYITSIALTTVALTLYLTTTLAQFWHIWRSGAKYMLCMAIGGACYCVGLSLRYGLHWQPDSEGIYIGMYLFIVLSPCAFIAAEYILLGRLARELEMGQYLAVKPEKLTKVFVGSDITTFLIQAAGGSMSTSMVTTTRNIGRKIFLAGLILQLISFLFFTFLFLIWLYKVHRYAPTTWRRDAEAGRAWYKDWRTLASALSLSCVGILIRSFFRAIENAEGWLGPLTTNEKYFYSLDSLPLFIAIVVYVPFWPGSFIRRDLPSSCRDEESQGTPDLAAGASKTSGDVTDNSMAPSSEEKDPVAAIIDIEEKADS